MCINEGGMTAMQRSEDNMWNLGLSFHIVGSRDQVFRIVCFKLCFVLCIYKY